MTTMTLPNASNVEIAQLLLALIAVGVGFWRLWVALENTLYITGTSSIDLRRLLAETQVLGELFRLFMYGCLTAIGVISVLLAPPAPDSVSETLQATLVRFGLITVTVTMIADSLVQEYRRRLFFTRVDDQAVVSTATAVAEDVHRSEVEKIGDRLQTTIGQHAEAQMVEIRKGTDAAHAAYEEANTINQKIENLNQRLLKKETDDKPHA